MEILENILMARDEIFKTDEKIFIYTVKVQELIHEGNMSLKFNSEFEKSISKEAVVQKQTVKNQEIKLSRIRKTNQRRKNSKRENSKYHMQEKNEDTRIPSKKVPLSSAEMAKYHGTKKCFF